MKTELYLNGKKTSKAEIIGIVGKDRVTRMINESKAAFLEDPNEENSYFIGRGMLTIVLK